MKNLSIMLKPASSLCNLRCKYCFYADISNMRSVKSCGIMTQETVFSILENVKSDLSAGDKITFVFQGGEPTLAGLDFFKNFVTAVRQWDISVQVSFSLQTNGILIDDEWCLFLKENNFLVGVSLDLLPECHDDVRVDSKNDGTYKSVLKSIRLLDKYKVEYNVLCTLTNAIARYPGKVWNRILELDIRYIQFTPCLGELERAENTLYALTPKRFASFYTELFGYWLEAYKRKNYRSIKFFDDVVNLMVFSRPTSCGMNGSCQSQLVIEADGSAYPCDFYCIDDYCIGNLCKQGFIELLGSQKAQEFINRPHTKPIMCENCPYAGFCGGNCKRMQKEICCDVKDTYCGYRKFLENCGSELAKIAREEYRRLIQIR